MGLDEILEYPNDIREHYIKCIKTCPWRNFIKNKWYYLSGKIVDSIDETNYLIYNDTDRNYYILPQRTLQKYFIF